MASEQRTEPDRPEHSFQACPQGYDRVRPLQRQSITTHRDSSHEGRINRSGNTAFARLLRLWEGVFLFLWKVHPMKLCYTLLALHPVRN